MHFSGGRRFNSYASWCIATYGTRLQKLSVDAGFSCPNRDGTLGTGGCSFCLNDGFNPSYCDPHKSITQQLDEGISFHRTRYRRAVKYIAYFQAYSNTYAALDHLRRTYMEALLHADISGISIGTRPDCIDKGVLDLLQELSANYRVSLELGVESCNDRTLQRVKRGHDFACSKKAIEDAAARGIQTGAHFILGLPGESRQEMLDQSQIINSLPLHSVKFHQLQIMKGTLMQKEYAEDPGAFSLFSLEQYIEFIIDLLERLRPTLLIERLCGEVPPRFLAVPGWGLIRNDEVIRRIEKRMEERGSRQGIKVSGQQ
jgi:radical SAM protein (TIGR01212 family)